MIPASVHPRFAAWMTRRIEARLRRTFGRVRVAGDEALRELAENRPVLLVANHSTWWDGMLVAWSTRSVLGLNGFAMMDAQHLRRLPFFAALGGFGVDPRSRRDGARAIRYAASLLRAPRRLVWIFPQGAERSWHERPLSFRPGASRIARLSGAAIVPVGLAYRFGLEERPEAWMRFGAPIVDDRGDDLGPSVEHELDALVRAFAGDDAAFGDRLVARPSWSGRVAERLLAWWMARRLDTTARAYGERALAPCDAARHESA